MKKRIRNFAFVLTCLLLPVSGAWGQAAEMVDNVEIVAMKSMQVRSNILTIVTKIKNDNPQRVKISEGKFAFYLRINKTKDENLTEDEKLGMDDQVEKEIILKTADEIRDQDGRDTQEVIFEIDLGEGEKRVRSLERILNAVGDPMRTNPIFYIRGRFYLGLKSDKGWSSVKAGLNWVFRPELQRNVLLGTSMEMPFPDIREALSKECVAREDLKFCRDCHEITDKTAKKRLKEYAHIQKRLSGHEGHHCRTCLPIGDKKTQQGAFPQKDKGSEKSFGQSGSR